MSPEEQFARHICRSLDQGVRSLDPAIVERLRAARFRALDRQRVQAASVEHSHSIFGAGGTAQLGSDEDERHPLRNFLAIAALLLGVSIAYYWNSFDQADENEEIDSALLADELSPKAYLDPGFQAWLSHYAQSSER